MPQPEDTSVLQPDSQAVKPVCPTSLDAYEGLLHSRLLPQLFLHVLRHPDSLWRSFWAFVTPISFLSSTLTAFQDNFCSSYHWYWKLQMTFFLIVKSPFLFTFLTFSWWWCYFLLTIAQGQIWTWLASKTFEREKQKCPARDRTFLLQDNAICWIYSLTSASSRIISRYFVNCNLHSDKTFISACSWPLQWSPYLYSLLSCTPRLVQKDAGRNLSHKVPSFYCFLSHLWFCNSLSTTISTIFHAFHPDLQSSWFKAVIYVPSTQYSPHAGFARSPSLTSATTFPASWFSYPVPALTLCHHFHANSPALRMMIFSGASSHIRQPVSAVQPSQLTTQTTRHRSVWQQCCKHIIKPLNLPSGHYYYQRILYSIEHLSYLLRSATKCHNHMISLTHLYVYQRKHCTDLWRIVTANTTTTF